MQRILLHYSYLWSLPVGTKGQCYAKLEYIYDKCLVYAPKLFSTPIMRQSRIIYCLGFNGNIISDGMRLIVSPNSTIVPKGFSNLIFTNSTGCPNRPTTTIDCSVIDGRHIFKALDRDLNVELVAVKDSASRSVRSSALQTLRPQKTAEAFSAQFSDKLCRFPFNIDDIAKL